MHPTALRATLGLVAFLAAGLACAQSRPPPAAPLPDADKLPSTRPDTRLPGPDPRLCGPSKWSAICASGRWTQFSRIELRVAAPRFTARYEIEQAGNGEIHATYSEHNGEHQRGGEVVLVGADGFAYRSREKFPDPGSIIDYTLSSPLMMAELVAILLDRGVLGPPAEVGKRQAIDASSATQYLRTAAPRTAALYGPPWSMTGTVQAEGNSVIAFSLRLRYRPVDRAGRAIAGKTDALTLEGTVSYQPRRPLLPDSLDLAGWKLMKGEEALPPALTLGEARQAVGP